MRWALFFGVAACSSPLDAHLQIGPEIQSLSYGIASERGVSMIAAAPPFELQETSQGDLTLLALLYEQPLEALGLSEGQIIGGLNEDPDRSLPLLLGDGVFVAEVGSDAVEDWREVSVIPPPFDRFRLTAKAPAECFEDGGCYRARSDGQSLCQADCPAPSPPDPPEPPAPPQLTPCPEGWTEVREADQASAYCEPWPQSPHNDTCPTGQARYPGMTSCAGLGAPCPTGDWPMLPAGASAIYVSTAGTPGGLGTEASPLATLSGALSIASPDDIIVLSEGQHQADVVISSAATILGACTERSALIGRLDVNAANVSLSNLRIEGSLLINSQGALTVSGVEVDVPEPPTSDAIFVMGSLQGGSLLVRRPGFMGLRMGAEAVVDLSRMMIENVTLGAISVSGAEAQLTLSDCAIRGGDAASSPALWAGEGATVHLERCVMERLQGGPSIFESAELTALDLVVRDGVGNIANGLQTIDGGRMVAQRVFIDRAVQVGALAKNATLQLSDAIIRDVAYRPEDQIGGGGATFSEGGSGRLERVHIQNGHNWGVFIFGEGANVQLFDVRIEGTRREPGGDLSTGGLGVQTGGRATFERLHIEDNEASGVFVEGDGSTLDGDDLTILETLPAPASGSALRLARTLWAAGGAFIEIDRMHLDRNPGRGILLEQSETRAVLSHLLIENTSAPEDCAMAQGCPSAIHTQFSAELHVKDFQLSKNGRYGLSVLSEGSLLLEDGMIDGHETGALFGVNAPSAQPSLQGVLFKNNRTAFASQR